MSSIGPALLDSLRSIERPGDFCIGSVREIPMPTIEVEGVGRLAFPLLGIQAEQLMAIAEAAPYGRGRETAVDLGVRRTWQIGPGRVRIGGRHWERTLAELVAEAGRGLGVSEPVVADFYKLLIYDAGSFFIDHRDTEKVPGMFATMVIELPSLHRGGELIVKHLGREVVLDLHPEEPSEIGLAAFYADCVHKVRPVIEGWRATLVYSLRFPDDMSALAAPDYRTQQARVRDLLLGWAGAADEPVKLILPLEHAYTPAALSFSALKGADAGVASVLAAAAQEAGCELHLALVSIEESGSAEHHGYHRRRRWRGGEEEDDEEFEVVEVLDQAMLLSAWRRPDGGEAGLGEIPFEADELCPPDAFDGLTPDEQHFHEATGNEGASFERTYRRGGLVLWPRARRLAVLNQAGLLTTLPYLEAMTARWQADGSDTGSPLWREASELSLHMLRSWPRDAWRDRGEDDHLSRMLDLQVRLSNGPCVESFLGDVSAGGHYAACDNEAIMRAAALMPGPRFSDLMVRIIARNASRHLSACGDLLVRCLASPTIVAGDAERIGAALLDALPGDRTKPAEANEWARPSSVKPGFIVDLLTATCRIDASLAARAVEHLLAWPKTYDPDDVLVPALRVLADVEEGRSSPAVGRLRDAALGHLRRRIALPLEPPRDWARDNRLRCTCSDCHALGAFLAAPDQREWRLKAIQDRRTHVEQSVRQAACDLDLATERRGSPHTLVAVKNQASYERRAAQRRLDLDNVGVLSR